MIKQEIWRVVDERGGLRWLAEETGYNWTHLWKVRKDIVPAGKGLRAAVALALGIQIDEVA